MRRGELMWLNSQECLKKLFIFVAKRRTVPRYVFRVRDSRWDWVLLGTIIVRILFRQRLYGSFICKASLSCNAFCLGNTQFWAKNMHHMSNVTEVSFGASRISSTRRFKCIIVSLGLFTLLSVCIFTTLSGAFAYTIAYMDDVIIHNSSSLNLHQ